MAPQARVAPSAHETIKGADAVAYSAGARAPSLPARQSVSVHGKRSTDPERIGQMIPAWVGRIRMDQNAQASMIEHQPRHQFGKYFGSKGDLTHGLIMRAHLDVVPTPQGDGETLADPGAQPLGLRPRCRRVVVDVSVVACDLACRSRSQTFRQIGHGCCSSSVTGEVITRNIRSTRPVFEIACSTPGGRKMKSCFRTTWLLPAISISPSPSSTW